MNQDELKARVFEQQKADLDLLIRKDNDYNGPENSLGGFRDFGFLGVLVRLSDKLTRLRTLYKSGHSLVDSESFADTLQDIRNYSHIGQIVWENERQNEQSNTSIASSATGKASQYPMRTTRMASVPDAGPPYGSKKR